jgi:glycosyltransferase involved in cell wall biosynthesis
MSHSDPLVSCIVPVFNAERHLGEALSSIAAQTYPATEIIVVDDGSQDGSARVATEGPHAVRYLYQPNAGPAAARNTGIRAASGHFVAFLDADDRWHPEKIERQMRLMRGAPEVDVTVGMAVMFDDPDSTSEAGGRPVGVPIPAFITGTILARKEMFTRVGWFDEGRRHSDVAAWFIRARTMDAGIVCLPDVLLYRRLHATNMSRTGRSGSIDEYLRLLKSHLDHARASGKSNSAK